MSNAVRDFFLQVCNIKKVGFSPADPFDDVQNPFPVWDVQAMAGFIGDQEQRRFDHSPGYKDHALLPI